MATTLSGSEWWHANQAHYPNSSSVDDLEPSFGSCVERFLDALRSAGASIIVSSTRRNATRAQLMHYSWKVAYGDTEPEDVPKIPGATIDWDHGETAASRAAAMDMVKLFGMAHIASLTSNHITGKAIDMTISWKGTLRVTKPSPALWEIESTPHTGDNRELHELGQTLFDVRKLRTDPPHWSFNGR